MLGRVRGALTYANVMATVAAFIALGGGAYAALKLPKNSVGAKQIRKDAVRSPDVKDGALLARDFAAGQLPRGATGPAGAKGDAGPKGDPGPKGDAGAPGKDFEYSRIVVVKGDGTDAENGARLLAAHDAIGDEGTVLINLEPGFYDLGTAGLSLKDGVHLQGSGTQATFVTSGPAQGTATLTIQRGAQVRDLQVATRASDTFAIEVASGPVFIENAEVAASAAGKAIGIRAEGRTRVKDTSVFATSDTAGAVGIETALQEPLEVIDSRIQVHGQSVEALGIAADDGTAVALRGSEVRVDGGGAGGAFAVSVGTAPDGHVIEGSSLLATGEGPTATALIQWSNADMTVIGSRLRAREFGDGSAAGIAIPAGTVRVRGSIVEVGAGHAAVTTSGTALIDASELIGNVDGSGTARIGASKVTGAVTANSRTCINSYTGTYSALSCP